MDHVCDICGEDGLTVEAIKLHLQEAHAESPSNKCLFCELQGVTPYELTIHINSVHFGLDGELIGVDHDTRQSIVHQPVDEGSRQLPKRPRLTESQTDQKQFNNSNNDDVLTTPSRGYKLQGRSLVYSRDDPTSIVAPNLSPNNSNENSDSHIDYGQSCSGLTGDNLFKLDNQPGVSGVQIESCFSGHSVYSATSLLDDSVSKKTTSTSLLDDSVLKQINNLNSITASGSYNDCRDDDAFGTQSNLDSVPSIDRFRPELYETTDAFSDFSESSEVQKCPICEYVVENEFLLSVHFTAEHSAPRESRSDLNQTYQNKQSTNGYHQRSDHELFDEGFSDHQANLSRFDTAPPGDFVLDRHGVDISSTFACPVCDLEFVDNTQLEYHVERHFSDGNGRLP